MREMETAGCTILHWKSILYYSASDSDEKLQLVRLGRTSHEAAGGHQQGPALARLVGLQPGSRALPVNLFVVNDHN